MKKKLIVMLSIAVFSCVTSASAKDLKDVNKIVEKANLAAYYSGADGVSDVNMSIMDAQGRERIREFRILRLTQEEGGEQKFYVYFKQPADVAKMVFMVWKHVGADDDRWLYLPALDLVRRISASDKRSSFAGSHFVYEDVSGRGIEADKHELIETTEQYYKIKNTPKETKGVEFKYYYVWIDKANFVPMKAEYYNADDALVRTIEASAVQEIDDYPTVTKSVATDLERGGKTTMTFTNIKYEVGLTDDLFTERYLRKAPAEWIK